MVTSNGYAPAVIDLETRRLTTFRENLYRYPAPGRETRNLAYDLYLGLRVAGQSRWLTEVAFDEAGYETGTNLIRTVQRDRGVRVTTTYVAPMTLDARALLVTAEVSNEGPDTTDVAIFSIHNFLVGGGAGRNENERIVWDAALGAYLESGTSGGVLIAKPLGTAKHAATPSNPFPLVNMNALFTDVDDSGVRTDAVSGFQLDVAGRGAFSSGASAAVGLIVAWVPDGNASSAVAAIDAWIAGRGPASILEDERRAWTAWRALGSVPVTTNDDERRISDQALALLRTAQVREPGSPNGQIVASLPPGMWDITWVRDGTFAIEALTATGHHDEAEAALEFFIRGPFGEYLSQVGRPYGLSVARYYGNGAEESDSNANGPNVELDGFGLYLRAAANHVLSAPGGAAWLARRRAQIDEGITDVLLHVRDPVTGLVAADSSIWESHWDNGGRQRWAFTSGMAAIGLSAWADAIAAKVGASDPGAADARARAAELVAALRMHLVDPMTGALGASVEQLAQPDARFADAQVAFVLDPRTITASSATGLATLEFLRSSLFLASTTGRGYRRNDDGDAYDNREWAVVDLAIARALRAAGRASEADALIAWITGQAAVNYLLVPELLDQVTGTFAGEVPMIGFGAGAYLSTLIDRSGTQMAPAALADGGVDSGTLDGGSSGSQDGSVSLDGDGVGLDAGSDGGSDLGSDSGSGSVLDGGLSGADARVGDASGGGERDAEARVDGGRVGGKESSCSCRSSGASRSSLAFLWLVIGLLMRRRFGGFAAPARDAVGSVRGPGQAADGQAGQAG